MISTNWGKALKTVVEEFTQDGYEEFSDWSTQIFNVKNDSSGYLEFQDAFGPASIPVSGEGASSPELSITLGYNTTVRPTIFKAKMPISQELDRWNKYKGQILDRSKALGSAGIQTINRFFAGSFIGAFNTAVTGYGDGLPLCSTVHTRPDGGSTISNASSTGITLTDANLETGINALREAPGGTGKIINVGINDLILMAPNKLEKEAVVITGSLQRSGTPNNDLNWYRGNLTVFVNPWIGANAYDMSGNVGSDTAWFLIAKKVQKLKAIWDVHPTYTMWEDQDKNSFYTQLYMSMSRTWSDFRGVWGSKGDGLAYSS